MILLSRSIFVSFEDLFFSYKLHTVSFVEIQRNKVGIKPLLYYPKNHIQITFKIC